MNRLSIVVCAIAMDFSVLGALHAQDTPNPLTFTGAVGSAQVQSNLLHPSESTMLVISLLDSSGGRIKFCNSASYPWNLAIATTNTQAAATQQTVTQAQSAHTQLTVVASETTTDSDGMYCGIQFLTAA